MVYSYTEILHRNENELDEEMLVNLSSQCWKKQVKNTTDSAHIYIIKEILE